MYSDLSLPLLFTLEHDLYQVWLKATRILLNFQDLLDAPKDELLPISKYKQLSNSLRLIIAVSVFLVHPKRNDMQSHVWE